MDSLRPSSIFAFSQLPGDSVRENREPCLSEQQRTAALTVLTYLPLSGAREELKGFASELNMCVSLSVVSDSL